MTEQSHDEASVQGATNGMPGDSLNGQPAELAGSAGEGWKSSPELRRFWEGVKRLPAYIGLAAAIARDGDVPKSAKGVLAVGGGYAVSPIDLVPGVIPVAGQLDDLYVLLTAIQQSLKMMPADVADRHLEHAGITRDDIEGDLKSVRDIVRMAIEKSLVFGGKTLGRISRAAYGFANRQIRRRTGAGPA